MTAAVPTVVGGLGEFLEALPASVALSPSESFIALVDAGLGELAPAGGGDTARRHAQLRRLGRHDLSLARLAEGHADALTILSEAGVDPPSGARLGVWAAGPLEDLVARRERDGWHLDGRRSWCSGAPVLSHGLVRAAAPDGDRLFLVGLDDPGVSVVPDTWPAVGMAGSLTFDVQFDDVRLGDGGAVGEPGFYTERRGFWVGSAGVAAVWLGGAEAVATVVIDRAGDDPHRLAHLGAITSRLFAVGAVFELVERRIDDASTPISELERCARIVRQETESAATDILLRAGRATGAGPLSHDGDHARRVADLTVYLRQHHAEADLAVLGRLTRAAHHDSQRDCSDAATP